MDLTNFRSGDWLIVAGAAVMMIFGLALKWASLGPLTKNNAFDYFLTGGIAWLLLVAAGVITFVRAGGLLRLGHTRWSVIMLIATGVATGLMLLQLILGAGNEETSTGEKFHLDRANGMYIAFLAAAVAFAGAISNYRAEHSTRES